MRVKPSLFTLNLVILAVAASAAAEGGDLPAALAKACAPAKPRLVILVNGITGATSHFPAGTIDGPGPIMTAGEVACVVVAPANLMAFRYAVGFDGTEVLVASYPVVGAESTPQSRGTREGQRAAVAARDSRCEWHREGNRECGR